MNTGTAPAWRIGATVVGKPGRAGDDLVAGQQTAFVGQFRTGQRADGEQVRRRAGVDEQRAFDAQDSSQFTLERIALAPERQPEVEGGIDGGFDLVAIKHASTVGHGVCAGGERRGGRRGVGGRTVRAVDEGGILARQAQDFSFDRGGIVHVFRRQAATAASRPAQGTPNARA